MNCYFDTSAIVKLYVDEDHSSAVRKQLEKASLIMTSRVAYAETMAAFGQIHREERITSDEFDLIGSDFSSDWSRFVVKDVDEPLTQKAGGFAGKHGLRGFDAIHLATAVYFDELVEECSFLAFDEQLRDGASDVGLTVGEGG